MSGKVIFLLVVGTLMAGAPCKAAGNWNLVLPDTVVLDDGLATLGDIATGPIPAYAQKIVIRAGLEPNSLVTVSRQDILRRLVSAGLAQGVRLSGSDRSCLVVAGQRVDMADLQNEVRRTLHPLMPATQPGAPDSWFELELPEIGVAVSGSWSVAIDSKTILNPGRNLVRISVRDGDRTESISGVVTLHQFGEVARLQRNLTRDHPLNEDQFDWQWQDLADLEPGLAVNRSSLEGASSVRHLKAGDYLRQADLKETPVVLSGDSVDLQIRRGAVAVTVRGTARKNGCLGQTIPVRSDLTGRLVNARVAGPGLVEWRK